jgi:hypothetical protein
MPVIWLAMWLAYVLVAIPLLVVGIPICYVLARLNYTVTRKSRYYDRIITTWPDLFWLWGNEEDGIFPDWYEPALPRWKRAWYWTAFRNSTRNLPFVPLVGVRVKPGKVRFIGDADSTPLSAPPAGQSRWSFTWQGPYAGFLWMRNGRRLYQLWFGWKLLPRHATTPPADGLPLGFATDLKAF